MGKNRKHLAAVAEIFLSFLKCRWKSFLPPIPPCDKTEFFIYSARVPHRDSELEFRRVHGCREPAWADLGLLHARDNCVAWALSKAPNSGSGTPPWLLTGFW